MLVAFLIEHIPHFLLYLLQFDVVFVDGEIVLFLIGVREMLVGPFFQQLKLLSKSEAVMRGWLKMHILHNLSVTLTLWRIS